MYALQETIGARLKRLRTERRISQGELSRRSGVPQRTISAYEAERMQPAYPNGVALATALGVSADYLYTGKEKPKQNSLHPEIEAVVMRGIQRGMWVEDFERLIEMYLLARPDLADENQGRGATVPNEPLEPGQDDQ